MGHVNTQKRILESAKALRQEVLGTFEEQHVGQVWLELSETVRRHPRLLSGGSAGEPLCMTAAGTGVPGTASRTLVTVTAGGLGRSETSAKVFPGFVSPLSIPEGYMTFLVASSNNSVGIYPQVLFPQGPREGSTSLWRE